MMFPPVLANRNYRIYISGQFISLLGTSMQQLAMGWMIYKMTNSPMWLGLAGFSAQIPMFIFGLVAGVTVDHVNRHKLLMLTQALAAIQAITLAVLTFTGHINIYILIALEFLLGTINAFDMTTRQAFVVQIVGDKKHLPNAIAINSSVNNLTRLMGPALAGTIIVLIGEALCFLVNGISYIAVLIALYRLKASPYIPPVFNKKKMFSELKVGYDAIFKNTNMRNVLFYLAFISFFGMPYVNLLPAIAAHVPNGGPNVLGWIGSCVGIGSLISAIYLSNKKGAPTLAKQVGIGGIIFAIAMGCLSFSGEHLPLVLLCVFVTGMMLILQLASCNTMIQSTTEDNIRGRVMSFFNVALLGIAPFGSLVMGYQAEHFGLQTALFVNAIFCLLGSFVLYKLSPSINQYIKEKTIF